MQLKCDFLLISCLFLFFLDNFRFVQEKFRLASNARNKLFYLTYQMVLNVIKKKTTIKQDMWSTTTSQLNDALYYTELNFNRIFYIYLYSLINLAHTLMLMKANNLDTFYFNIFKTMSNTYFPTKNIKNFIAI